MNKFTISACGIFFGAATAYADAGPCSSATMITPIGTAYGYRNFPPSKRVIKIKKFGKDPFVCIEPSDGGDSYGYVTPPGMTWVYEPGRPGQEFLIVRKDWRRKD